VKPCLCMIAIVIVSLGLLGASCSPQSPTSTPVPHDPAPAGCTPGPVQTEWPRLEAVEPPEVAPGGEIQVTGSGGYLYREGACGQSYDESSRGFQLYWDAEPWEEIVCYVNHCQATLHVPGTATSGPHTLSVEGGSKLEVQVTRN
jgi:hypothetical protein